MCFPIGREIPAPHPPKECCLQRGFELYLFLGYQLSVPGTRSQPSAHRKIKMERKIWGSAFDFFGIDGITHPAL
jgi:hypothetical protein